MIPASRRAWSLLDEYHGPRPGPSERLISVTSMLKPARIARLEALHRAELPTAEPGEDTWALLGTAVHAALERAAELAEPRPLLVEHRAETVVTVDGVQWIVSGQCDVLEADGTLLDYKVTSAWTVSDGRKGKSDWECQLNSLRWLLERSGAVPRGTTKALAVWAVLRDWSATQAQRDAGYPQSQEVCVPIPMWTPDETLCFIEERIRAHEMARTSLPACTPEERWAKDAGFAVLKTPKSLRAERICTRREDAERYRDEVLGGKGVIEERIGKSVRCERYCRVAPFCDFAQKNVYKR